VLAADVEAKLAAGDVEAARAAGDELDEIAAAFDSAYLRVGRVRTRVRAARRR
jgi:hypothetical protein